MNTFPLAVDEARLAHHAQAQRDRGGFVPESLPHPLEPAGDGPTRDPLPEPEVTRSTAVDEDELATLEALMRANGTPVPALARPTAATPIGNRRAPTTSLRHPPRRATAVHRRTTDATDAAPRTPSRRRRRAARAAPRTGAGRLAAPATPRPPAARQPLRRASAPAARSDTAEPPRSRHAMSRRPAPARDRPPRSTPEPRDTGHARDLDPPARPRPTARRSNTHQARRTRAGPGRCGRCVARRRQADPPWTPRDGRCPPWRAR